MGLNTDAVESIHSLLHRTAYAYRVSVQRLQVLVSAEKHDARIYQRSFKVPGDVLGLNVAAARLIEGSEILSGRKDMRSTSLNRLGSVLGHGSGLVARRFRFCPDCIDPIRGLGYGMLAHQLLYVGHCPVHGTALIERCLSCAAQISIAHDFCREPVCKHCGDRLWTQRLTPPPRPKSFYWREAQILALMQLAPDDSRTIISSSWPADFRSEVRFLSKSSQGYDLLERKMIREAAKRVVPHPLRSTVDELLRIAMIQACDVTDLILRPKESLSPRLPDIRRSAAFRVQRLRKQRSLWEDVRRMIVELMKTEEMLTLPSKRSLLKGSGLAVSGISQRFGPLAKEYDYERKRRLELRRDAIEVRALRLAEDLARNAAMPGVAFDIRRMAAHVMTETGVSKHVAERFVSGARNFVIICRRIDEVQDEMQFSY